MYPKRRLFVIVWVFFVKNKVLVNKQHPNSLKD